MPADPNARRDKALEDIARTLGSIDGYLRAIERNTRPVKQTLYDQAVEAHERPDPFSVPQVPQPGKDTQPEPNKPDYPQSSHPYFNRSTYDREVKRSGGLGYEGPYGYGNGQPYS